MSNELIIKYIKDNYITQKLLYFWSTFILPDGEFIIPENEEYNGDLYEHANIIAGVAENCFNDNWMDAEEWLENNCVKCNATFPYVGFPPNPTNKLYWAAEEYIDYINKEGNSFEGVVDYAEAETMLTPVLIITSRDSKIYDLAIYSANDIIDLVKRGRISGVLGESKNRKAFRLLIEDLDSMLPYYKNLLGLDKTYLLSFLSKDPTWNEKKEAGLYSKWILDKLNRQIISNGDLGHLGDLLSRFEDNKKQLKDKDINKFKTLVDLEDYLNNEENYTELSHRLEVRQRLKDRHDVDLNNEADLIYEDNEWEIWIPKTYAASCKLGQGTKWCTATTESDYYYKLYTNGNRKLYIFINKQNRKKKYLLSAKNMDFMDAEDESVDYKSFMFKNPDVYNFLIAYSKSKNIRISNFEERLNIVKEYEAKNWVYEYKSLPIDPDIRKLIKKIIIPDTVTHIEDRAFSNCENLESVEIPNSLVSIGEYAFYNCSSLTTIIIPSGVTSIGDDAFYNCAAEIIWGDNPTITEIGDYAFYGYKGTSITIPDSVTSIGVYAFRYCISLISIAIPDSVTEISVGAFYACTSLTSIEIPNSVKNIGRYVFYRCSNLTIYCEAQSLPSGWSDEWNPSKRPVIWNYKNKQNESLKGKNMKNIVEMELNQVPDRKPDGQSRITFGDGNRERILAYLGLDSFSDLDELEDAIARAFEVEDEYLHQLKRGDFGYALTADFESIPHIIEDPADYKDLEEIESFGGITVYRKIKK